MKKKKEPDSSALQLEEYNRKRREILDLCYSRLREMIPECGNEVTLLKCIEIIEKREVGADDGREGKALHVIADTLDRLAAIRPVK
ncbi:hypothetical protein [Coprobacter tertius]|uniref:Uncharacterized protein n=1 Tax=Coprobacter tertius TaxID=2944915 RepID=A0ABT1MIV9_9BACT|nr:hypothetical protein [Coprobacter tertius]MCP9612557.1 hypothetical protein [Coprobacter tertius]